MVLFWMLSSHVRKDLSFLIMPVSQWWSVAFSKSGHLGQVRTSSDNNELSSRKEVDAVDLISYAKALQPYISESKKKAEYISVIFSNFIDDDSIGGCSFF